MIPLIYHGSKKEQHGTGQLVGYEENPRYKGAWIIQLSSGQILQYARRESFTLLEE